MYKMYEYVSCGISWVFVYYFLLDISFVYHLGITEFDGKQYHVGFPQKRISKENRWIYFSLSVFLVRIVEKQLHHNFIRLIMIIYVEHVMKHDFLVNVVENAVQWLHRLVLHLLVLLIMRLVSCVCINHLNQRFTRKNCVLTVVWGYEKVKGWELVFLTYSFFRMQLYHQNMFLESSYAILM
jgi:hypothetical protein